MVRLKTAVDAEVVAIRALGYIAADETLFERFLALTGFGAEDIRERVTDPGFLGGVLDFLLGDERLVIAFAEASDLAPEVPMMARRKLPGLMPDGGLRQLRPQAGLVGPGRGARRRVGAGLNTRNIGLCYESGRDLVPWLDGEK